MPGTAHQKYLVLTLALDHLQLIPILATGHQQLVLTPALNHLQLVLTPKESTNLHTKE